jgi:hypothetical protein
MMRLPRLSASCRRRVRAVRRQISNDLESGEGRSAGLKCRATRGDRNGREMAKMLDRSRCKRHRQERRIRQERRRGEMDRRADGAKIVRLVCGMLLGRGRVGRDRASDDGAVRNVLKMEVSERKD